MDTQTLLNASLVEIKLGAYGVASSTALSDATLLSTVRNYKRQVASRMFPLGREDISKKSPTLNTMSAGRSMISVISPQFIRIREDKEFNSVDVRIDQITDLVSVAMSDVSASEMTMAKCTVQEREVYIKVLKGATMVRKFVRWKTNKEADGNDYPAYVVHFTDFSPNRKTPLTRELRVSNSESQIKQLWDDLKSANIKKGWDIYVAPQEET